MQHMKKRLWLLTMVLLLLLLAGLLAACTSESTSADTTPEITEAATVLEESSTTADTDPVIPPEESVEETTPSEDTAADTLPPETEAPTEPPVEVVIPDVTYPSLGHLLTGKSTIVSEDWSFKNTSLGSLKTNGTFVSTGGTLFQSSEDGLTSNNTGWDALGFATPVSTDTYTAEVSFAVHKNNRSGSFNAAMVGLFCKSAENLFIDGGLWFSFRDNQVAVYVKSSFEKVIDSKLPFDAADGVRFKAEGNREGVTVYANDTLIATVTISAEGITVLDAKGTEVAKTDPTHLSVDGTGYFRYMSHYANATLSSMKLAGETARAYAPADKVYAFLSGVPYAFSDKEQYLADIPTAIYSGLCYADGVTLGKMLDFDCALEGDTLTMTRDGATLVFTANTAEVRINGETHPFPTVVQRKGYLLLAASVLGEMMGYQTDTSEGLTVLATEPNLTQGAKSMAQERFDLYRDVVYNYEDVECDQTGVGRYDPVPYEERLVGIAYTTWHRPATKWGGTSTWDLPLYGTYCSDDEEVIRRHGELLRDAGVDFVFVDWSNNTEYDPVTMREQRADFRMIEEATDKLFDIWATIEGAPKICIFVGPGHNGPQTIGSGAHQKKVDQVWRDYVTHPDRADMYFHYDGKPLLICYGATPNQYTATPERLWDDARYTVRWMTGYVGQQGDLFRSRTLESNGFWSWEERGAQTYTVHNRMVEAVTVSAATRKQANEGESGYIPEAGRQNGVTLKKQFQRACDLGARLVLIVSWNEWTTGEQPSAEVSKDMEPSVIHGTFYYDLMREQIKKFKGLVVPEDQENA